MKIVEQPNSDWIHPSKMELALFHALTQLEGRPLSVAQWNDGIERGLKRWEAAMEHTPALAAVCTTLLHDLLITHTTYDDPNVEIVRMSREERADGQVT